MTSPADDADGTDGDTNPVADAFICMAILLLAMTAWYVYRGSALAVATVALLVVLTVAWGFIGVFAAAIPDDLR